MSNNDEKRKPIRIAQMMTEMNYGGVEMVVMNYYRHMDRRKVQFDFFVLEGSEIPQREEIEKLGGRIYVVPHYKQVIQYEKTLINLFKQNKYKIVHSHMNTLSVFSLRAAKKAGVPNRIAHNHSTAGKGEYKKNLVKYFLRPFSKVYPTNLAACSEAAGNWLFGKNEQFTVFENGIEIENYKFNEIKRNKIRRNLGIDDKKVIGHVGRLCYQKNQSFLLNIMKKLAENHDEYVLILIGDGEDKNWLLEQSRRFGIEDKVIFIGNVSDAFNYYSAMDVFVFPSRYEGLGIACVEAQVNGLPCIVSDNIPIQAIVSDNVKMLELNLDKWKKTIIESSRTTFNKLDVDVFDIDKNAKRLEHFYLGMI